MEKKSMYLKGLLPLALLVAANTVVAEPAHSISSLKVVKPTWAHPNFTFKQGKLTIKNDTKEPMQLEGATLRFYYKGKKIALMVDGKSFDQPKLLNAAKDERPHNKGNFYEITLHQMTKKTLGVGKSLSIQVQSEGNLDPEGFQLFQQIPVPVQVQVTTDPAGWTQTVKVCNNSGYTIPLTNVIFSFNFSGAINSVWGSPWVGWTVTAHQGNTYELSGGTPWTEPLKNDPNCTKPMTIQFDSTPTTPAPTGPFVLKSAGGHAMGSGTINILLSSLNGAGLANPKITVTGMGASNVQQVTWGQQWTLPNMVPGNYTVTAENLTNDVDYYSAASVNVSVQDTMTSMATINYQAAPASDIAVSLINPPKAQEPLMFTGAKYQISKVVNPSDTVHLPYDNYTVTSVEPGYSATIMPNPLSVPSATNVSVTYASAPLGGPRYGGYYESWSTEYQTDGANTKLANLPSYLNYVFLSFIRPDINYTAGSLTFAGTGLEFNYPSGSVLKQAIATLHQNHPNTKVLLAVGGATYTNWAGLNPSALANFVKDFGLDGVDIDYEPIGAGCSKGGDGLIHCAIDAEFQSVVEGLRQALPRPYQITVAAWSIGAYGEGQWQNSQPMGDYTGMMLPLLHSPAAKDLDMINVMSYDASNAFDPVEALNAYSNYFPGAISMGVEVPPEAWGGHVITMTEVNRLAQAVVAKAASHNTPASMMIWSVHKKPNGTPSATNPTAQMMSAEICQVLGLTDCSVVLNG